MAQKRYTEYKTVASSFFLDKMLFGIIPSGRYSGFDVMTPDSGALTFIISHSADAFRDVDIEETLGNQMGIWRSPQGTVITEDEALASMGVDTNASNAFERIDIIVGQHSYDETTIGGQLATYIIIKGANGGPVEPALGDPATQTKIGRIRIPASASNLDNAIYESARVEGLGGYDPALLNLQNTFKAEIQQYEDPNSLSVQTVAGDNLIELAGTGNAYRININAKTDLDGITTKQNGTEISLVFYQSGGNQYIDLNNGSTLAVGNQAKYTGFYFPYYGLGQTYRLYALVQYTFRKVAVNLLGLWVDTWALVGRSDEVVQDARMANNFVEVKRTSNYADQATTFKLSFNTVVEDSLGLWDETNKVFKPLRSGRYLVIVRTFISFISGSGSIAGDGLIGLKAFKDGVLYKYLHSPFTFGESYDMDSIIELKGQFMISLVGSELGTPSELSLLFDPSTLSSGQVSAFRQNGNSTDKLNYLQIRYLGV